MDRRILIAAALTALCAAALAAAWRYAGPNLGPLAPPHAVQTQPSPTSQAFPQQAFPQQASPPSQASPPQASVSTQSAAQPHPPNEDRALGASTVAPLAPSFDVVRVERDGSAVVAGRAAPGADVVLSVDGAPVARGRADANGQFVLLPPPLSPGGRTLSLTAHFGGAAVPSRQTVTVLGAETPEGAPMVALAEPDAPTRLLSEVAPSKAAETKAGATRIRTAEAEQGGAFYATGEAKPGATVRLYLNDALVAQTKTRPDGGWSVRIEKGMTPGAYAFRADSLASDGKVSGRAEVAFRYPEASAAATASDASAAPSQASSTAERKSADASVRELRSATVSQGDSLWRLSARIYGSGERYTEIYKANSAQIRNPDLIYPGQILVAPAPATPGG